LPDQSRCLSGGRGRKARLLFDQEDVAPAAARQGIGGGGADGSAPDNDDFSIAKPSHSSPLIRRR
jgi:hypothetical protein